MARKASGGGGRASRSLEVYLTILVAAAVSLLNLFDVVDAELVATATLGILALIALDLLQNSQQVQRVGDALRELNAHAGSRSGPRERLIGPTDGTGRPVLDRATDIRLIGVTLNRTIRSNLAELEQRLAAGALVRVAILDPDGAAVREAARRNGVPEDAAVFEHRLRPTIDALRYLATCARPPGRLEVRLLSFVPAFGMTLVDPDSADSSGTVDIYSHHPTGRELVLHLRPGQDPDLHRHFRAEFDRIWHSGRPAPVGPGRIPPSGPAPPGQQAGRSDRCAGPGKGKAEAPPVRQPAESVTGG
ncbi:DUF5919 domain-containing protein [Micromonospora echinofusca]|uniref:DUF5919 domain-containing protein n=1 Tax=Micromonospora echinofusca TaxID=47858 RepID=A0ABS3VZI5_MICEH|nr:DUF5919 domain-containing protein [Micromonospora echinofusca]MBO4209934.1 hypothetical protein [Micromonospora echinofusca]